MSAKKPSSIKDKAVGLPAGTLRLGLCCQFAEVDIAFRTTTATAMGKLAKPARLARLGDLCLGNARALRRALEWCAANGVGSFRINSQLFPVQTHPSSGYRIDELPVAEALVAELKACAAFARSKGLRTGFHPDQFVVLSSPDEEVVRRSLADLEAQSEIAELVGADTVNIHGGGGYGDKPAALARFRKNADRLSSRARSRLTVENDDKTYSPEDLLPLCRDTGIPLVYDVHHHRCHADSLSVREATEAAISSWTREPLFHISSPLEGWKGKGPERHHDYIDVADFPKEWRGLGITVEVEAKAKELAVIKLKNALGPQA
jgi:UV DNA damage endonuclease